MKQLNEISDLDAIEVAKLSDDGFIYDKFTPERRGRHLQVHLRNSDGAASCTIVTEPEFLNEAQKKYLEDNGYHIPNQYAVGVGEVSVGIEHVVMPLRLDKESGYIFDAEVKHIADVRGWGWIQNVVADNNEALEFQDRMGQWLVDRINASHPQAATPAADKEVEIDDEEQKMLWENFRSNNNTISGHLNSLALHMSGRQWQDSFTKDRLSTLIAKSNDNIATYWALLPTASLTTPSGIEVDWEKVEDIVGEQIKAYNGDDRGRDEIVQNLKQNLRTLHSAGVGNKENDAPLTDDILIQYGFERWQDSDDEDGDSIQWHNNITLHTSNWQPEDYNFATRVRDDGTFKSGYGVKTLGKLKELYKSITRHDLLPHPPAGDKKE